MCEQIDAIYDDGVLKPLVPLSLPDKSRVRLTVDRQQDAGAVVEPRDEWERELLQVPRDCGVSLPNLAVSSEELYE